jgi:pimeloyl-ACP methyl ester carboxylesterase
VEGSSAIRQRVRYLSTYTARGHGNSSGWEETAESDPWQFTWRDLAQDMIAVHEYIEFNLLPRGPNHIDSMTMKNKVILGGSSMGAATALYACIEQPDIVAALILIRPPTAWKEREARRKYLNASALRLRERSAELSKYHFVLSGAMLSDLPMITESKPSSTSPGALLQESPHGSDLYDKITCPVLILTIEGKVHMYRYRLCTAFRF